MNRSNKTESGIRVIHMLCDFLASNRSPFQNLFERHPGTSKLRPKIYLCVFQISRPYLGFCPDPKHFIVNFEENTVKYAENFLYKIF